MCINLSILSGLRNPVLNSLHLLSNQVLLSFEPLSYTRIIYTLHSRSLSIIMCPVPYVWKHILYFYISVCVFFVYIC